jgi:hypothetical protein
MVKVSAAARLQPKEQDVQPADAGVGSADESVLSKYAQRSNKKEEHKTKILRPLVAQACINPEQAAVQPCTLYLNERVPTRAWHFRRPPTEFPSSVPPF